jgi:hypothetical protein
MILNIIITTGFTECNGYIGCQPHSVLYVFGNEIESNTYVNGITPQISITFIIYCIYFILPIILAFITTVIFSKTNSKLLEK